MCGKTSIGHGILLYQGLCISQAKKCLMLIRKIAWSKPNIKRALLKYSL